MAANVTIPKLGMTMKEATLVEWKFSEGDTINKDDVVLVIETEKTKWEVEAAASGLLHIIVSTDNTEAIGTVVGMIAETADELASIQAEAPAPTVVEVSETDAAPAASADKPKKAAASGGRVKASPVAKKMAAEMGVDLASVEGSGPGGRITKQDVEKAAKAPKAAPAAAQAASGGTGEERDGKAVKEVIPLKGMRKAISDHMHQSLASSAQLTSMGEIDMTKLKELRADLVAQEDKLGVRITYNHLYVAALAKTLKEIPMVNSSLIDGEIIIWEDINIGVAVALEGADALGGGLIVPVIRNADRKSVTDIARELRDTVARAREGKAMPDDVSGGTFTLTNMGGAGGGWGYGTPIINQPQSAILGTGAIVDRAIVVNGEVVAKPMMPVSFTFDHRVLDGVPAGMFMGRFGQLIKDPLLLLV